MGLGMGTTAVVVDGGMEGRYDCSHKAEQVGGRRDQSRKAKGIGGCGCDHKATNHATCNVLVSIPVANVAMLMDRNSHTGTHELFSVQAAAKHHGHAVSFFLVSVRFRFLPGKIIWEVISPHRSGHFR